MDSADVFREPSDLRFLERENFPVPVAELSYPDFPDECRVLHYMVKRQRCDRIRLGEIEFLKGHIEKSVAAAEAAGADVEQRYMFVTVDQALLGKGQTLRDPGWHIDGMQGDEVPHKLPCDFQTVWSDCMPTEYARGPFDMSGVDPSVHNVFRHLSEQVANGDVESMDAGRMYGHSSYLVHRSAEAPRDRTYRRYIRVSMSMVPVTSVKMTVNPDIGYDYEIHSTDGEIPGHLI